MPPKPEKKPFARRKGPAAFLARHSAQKRLSRFWMRKLKAAEGKPIDIAFRRGGFFNGQDYVVLLSRNYVPGIKRPSNKTAMVYSPQGKFQKFADCDSYYATWRKQEIKKAQQTGGTTAQIKTPIKEYAQYLARKGAKVSKRDMHGNFTCEIDIL